MASFISRLIHNRFLLYSVFLIALADFLYLVATNDIESASLFGLIGILTAFFSKNMIVILSIAVIITNIVKFGSVKRGRKRQREGLKTKGKDEGEDDEGEDEGEDGGEDGGDNNSEAGDEADLSVENSKSKEKFGQDEAVVKATDEDKELDKSDKMILAQEKMLKRMNKYKPLLDTLNGLTRNMAAFKGVSTTDKE
jgi:hypothetical protein